MSGFSTAIGGGLRLKRRSEAVVSGEGKRRKRKKKPRQEDEEDTGPVVVDLPPELKQDAAAVAAAASLQIQHNLTEQGVTEGSGRDPHSPQTGDEAGDEEGGGAVVESSECKEKQGTENTGKNRRFEAPIPTETGESIEALLAETNPHWTAAERAFFLARKAREKERIKKQLQLTHRQRMEKFNQHLASLSEHFDQPRVGPG
ncbi:uncharacterized protein LOC34617438 [Cyclospora cayetanensis]|uniref:Uncharacterized protein LOC34617438 n=2 Tax=Cyclospora cayetanensis TaxID=88456 RepID=A0A6P5WDP4_9EIME|nr:uncharacterized protein LOC34617438 [Cyclospora cayetanensis]OEH78412.1 hypothetical protein cyc_00235 [Cyclospora cayetanensis]